MSEYAEGIDFSDYVSDPCFLDSLGGYSLAPRKLPLPKPIKKHRRCTHSRLSSYTQPCFRCDKYCNCDWNHDWPDVIVLSLDRKTVRLPSFFVRGSAELQIQIEKIREQKEKEKEGKRGHDASIEEEDSGFQEVEVIDLTLDEGSEEGLKKNLSVTGKGFQADVIDLTLDDSDNLSDEEEEGASILDLIEYEDNVVDLRTGDNVPNYGVSAHTYDLLLKYMELHLEQVDAAVAEERRTVKFFASSLFPRPPKGPSNHFAYEEWEEEFFNVDTVTFLSLSQAKYELIMFDFHYAVEKWTLMFRGRPAMVNMDDFGKGYYLWEPPNDEDDSGCQDFYLKKVYNPRKRSKHDKPTKYWTKHYGFTFPRSFSWKRTRN